MRSAPGRSCWPCTARVWPELEFAAWLRAQPQGRNRAVLAGPRAWLEECRVRNAELGSSVLLFSTKKPICECLGNTTLAFLCKSYWPTLTVEQVSEITSELPQTIRNLISEDSYRIPSFKIGCNRVFGLVDVTDFVDLQFQADPSHPSHVKPWRGRLTKVEQLARQQAAQQALQRPVHADGG